MGRLFPSLLAAILAAFLFSCGGGSSEGGGERVMRVSAGGRINTLDPALAADLVSQYMVANFYDTLLQYDYAKKPYALAPSMLESMPKIDADARRYEFKLRDDLYFQKDPCFPGDDRTCRKVTSADVVFSLLRIADARLKSPGFWLFRGKVKGIDEFRELTSYTKPGNFLPYDRGCAGFEILDERRFVIHLNAPDPRLLYALAMPYAGVVSRKAVEFYGDAFAERPVGSGPFRLVQWWRDYRVVLERNPDYRYEVFAEAEDPDDRKRPLPLLDRIVCYLVKQPLAEWLLFLQGELDMTSLSKDNFDLVVGRNQEICPALAERGIQLRRVPSFRVNYVGFSFTDPTLGGNPKLREAISLAYDTGRRVKHFNYRIKPANGPIPPGVPGYDESLKNPYGGHDVEKAKALLAEAGYPDGIDPTTGEPLSLNFDLSGNSTQHRQLAELMVDDMRKIGIDIVPSLNNKPRFFQKLREGQLQLFRLSWIGDYPDAENFLQLFYGPNAGSCNRVFYRDETFDKMFEEIKTMPDSPERTEKYKRMAAYLIERCPWIFESYPIDYRLTHDWLENYIPHDFAFSRWKYLDVNDKLRRKRRRAFTPLTMEELRGRGGGG